MTSTILSWYLEHAGLLFGICIVTAVVGEKLARWATGNDLELRSTATSIISGGAFLVVKTVLGKVLFLGATLWIYEHHRLFTLDLGNPLVWLGVFLMRDAVYYCVHRAEHTFNVLWASHLVHHSPETIGMATAIRVPWMEAIYKPFFSLWLPLVGFNPLAAVGMDVFAATLSQLQHTERFRNGSTSLIGKVFVTPSTHRVHHGYNAEYLDKNFGAVLIIWDRMFGTYEPEVAPVKFGVGEDDRVVTGADALKGGYPRLLAAVAATDGLRNRMKVLFGRPGSLPKPSTRTATSAGEVISDVVSVDSELGVDLLDLERPRNDERAVLLGEPRFGCVEHGPDHPMLRLGVAAGTEPGDHGHVGEVLAAVGDAVLILADAADPHAGHGRHVEVEDGLVNHVEQGVDVVMFGDVGGVLDDHVRHDDSLGSATTRRRRRPVEEFRNGCGERSRRHRLCQSEVGTSVSRVFDRIEARHSDTAGHRQDRHIDTPVGRVGQERRPQMADEEQPPVGNEPTIGIGDVEVHDGEIELHLSADFFSRSTGLYSRSRSRRQTAFRPVEAVRRPAR